MAGVTARLLQSSEQPVVPAPENVGANAANKPQQMRLPIASQIVTSFGTTDRCGGAMKIIFASLTTGKKISRHKSVVSVSGVYCPQ